MLHTPGAKLIKRRSWIQRRTVQLGGGLLLAFALPWFLRLAVLTNPPQHMLVVSDVANLLGVVLGYYIFRNLTAYPGIRPGFYILPAFAVSYAIVLTGIVALRYDYSRFVLSAGFLLSCLWFLFVFLLLQRARSPLIGVVPFGEADHLFGVPGAQWIGLTQPVLAAAAPCEAVVADFRVDLPDEWDRFLADAALNGKPVYHVKQLRESLSGKVAIDHLSENSFGSLIPNSTYTDLKRLADFLTACIALVVLALPLALCALAVRLDSPGPAFFTQTRIGRAGRPFRIIKLRTMHVDHEEASADRRQSAMTRDGDPRVTRMGRFLRRTRIDELPQVLNIVRGEMSWIGPRPEAHVLSAWYEAELPFYRYRHIVRPGITGWAQVNQGHVTDVSNVLNKLQYDFYYVKYFSLWLDILIVIATVRTVLTGFGSR